MKNNPLLFRVALFAIVAILLNGNVLAQGTRLLRQPTMSATQISFVYGGDIWVTDRNGGEARRITSTPATESDPHFSPDGKAERKLDVLVREILEVKRAGSGIR